MLSFSGDQVANREKVMCFCFVLKGDVLCGDGQMNDNIKALDGGGTTLRSLMGVGKVGRRAGIERMDRKEFVLCDHCFMFQGAEGRQYFTGV